MGGNGEWDENHVNDDGFSLDAHVNSDADSSAINDGADTFQMHGHELDGVVQKDDR